MVRKLFQPRRPGLINQRLAQPGPHETGIHDLFHGDVRFTGSEPVFDYPLVVIAFSNRSGSNLLAEYLRSTGRFSGLHEQLNLATVKQVAAKHGARSFTDYLITNDRLFRRAASIHGFKTTWDQLLMLIRWGIPAMYTGTKVIHMVRSDHLGQAVSFSIADQTKQWTSHVRERAGEPEFLYEDIEGRLYSAMLERLYVPYLARIFGLDMITINYQTLVDAPRDAVAAACAFCGRRLGPNWIPRPPRLERQATDANQAFADRYVALARRDILGKP